MQATAFAQLEFWLLILSSVLAPLLIWGMVLARRTASQTTILILGVLLVMISGVSFYLLQALAAHSKHSPSLADDSLFASELTLSLYLIPALFAGIGINFISDRLLGHVRENANDSERRPG